MLQVLEDETVKKRPVAQQLAMEVYQLYSAAGRRFVHDCLVLESVPAMWFQPSRYLEQHSRDRPRKRRERRRVAPLSFRTCEEDAGESSQPRRPNGRGTEEEEEATWETPYGTVR